MPTDRDVAFAAAPLAGRERQLDALLAQAQALDEREVELFSRTVAQLRMQVAQRRAPLGDDQAAAGVAIEAMHEVEFPRPPCGTQGLDDAVRGRPLPPCTAMPAGSFSTIRSRSSYRMEA